MSQIMNFSQSQTNHDNVIPNNPNSLDESTLNISAFHLNNTQEYINESAVKKDNLENGHHSLQSKITCPLDQNNISNAQQWLQSQPLHMIGILHFQNTTYVVKSDKVLIGRKGNNNKIDIDVGFSNFVSRTHLEIYKSANQGYMVRCVGKNGVFINEIYLSKENDPFELPAECNLHFPNTDISIKFKCLAYRDAREIELEIRAYISSLQDKNLLNLTNSIIQTNNSIISNSNLNQYNSDSLNALCPQNEAFVTKTSLDREIELQKNLNKTPEIHAKVVKRVKRKLDGYPNSYDQEEGVKDVWGRDDRDKFERNYSDNMCNTTISPNSKIVPNSLIKNNGSKPKNSYKKPPFSYAQLIVQVISGAPEGFLTLSGIYDALSDKYPYFDNTADKGWQNSVRHNLSLNRYFTKVPRSQDETGKGSYWKLDISKAPEPETLIEQAFMDKKTMAAVHSASSNGNGTGSGSFKNFSSKSHLFNPDSPGNYPDSARNNGFIGNSDGRRNEESDSNNYIINESSYSAEGRDGFKMAKKRGRPRLNKPRLNQNKSNPLTNYVNLKPGEDNTDKAIASLPIHNNAIDPYYPTITQNPVACDDSQIKSKISSQDLTNISNQLNHYETDSIFNNLGNRTERELENNVEDARAQHIEGMLDNTEPLDDAALMATSLFPETNPLKRAMIQQLLESAGGHQNF
ncbi:unnamed protein product [Gordionus sp. m RMFG-2023]|uniref:uncharacterized protein LOC135926257 n=1 Tax=Gordionus sp. m RMFG-2023 TaxID=3053472 RepID=UPI0030E42E1A